MLLDLTNGIVGLDETTRVHLTVRDVRALAASARLATLIAEDAEDAAERVSPAWQEIFRSKP